VVVSRGFVDQRFEANLFHLHLVLRHGLLVVVCRVSVRLGRLLLLLPVLAGRRRSPQ
jgi:hypothetical protein